jgi:hypothetical protein
MVVAALAAVGAIRSAPATAWVTSDDWQLRLANDAAVAISEGSAGPTQVLDNLFGGGTTAPSPEPALTAQWIGYRIAGPGARQSDTGAPSSSA